MWMVRGLAALAGAAALAPSAAAAAKPQVLGHATAAPVVRTAANGDLVALWPDGSRVRASFRLNGGRFFAPHAVPGLHSLDTRLGGVRPLMTTAGRAVVSWPVDRGARMLVAPAGRGGPFAAPQAAPTPRGPDDMVFSPDGHGAVLTGAGAGFSVVLGEPDGRWGAPQRLATRGTFPGVAVTDGGAVIVAWDDRDACSPRPPHVAAPQCEFVRVAVRPAGGVFGPPVALDAGPYHVGPPHPAIDAAGRPLVFWRRTAGTGGQHRPGSRQLHRRLRARDRPARHRPSRRGALPAAHAARAQRGGRAPAARRRRLRARRPRRGLRAAAQ